MLAGFELFDERLLVSYPRDMASHSEERLARSIIMSLDQAGISEQFNVATSLWLLGSALL